MRRTYQAAGGQRSARLGSGLRARLLCGTITCQSAGGSAASMRVGGCCTRAASEPVQTLRAAALPHLLGVLALHL